MTISKKLSISIITGLVLVGMLAFTTPTHAGFFDWFKRTDQTAQVSRSIGSRAVASANVDAQPTFWQRVFGTRNNTVSVNPSVASQASCGLNDPASITILTPNSGVYEAGDALNLTWESCNIPSSRQIFVQLRNAQTNSNVNLISAEETSNPNDGSAIINIPTSTASGYYRIRIGYSELSDQGMVISDISDAIEIVGTSNPDVGGVLPSSNPDIPTGIAPGSVPAVLSTANPGNSVCNMTVLAPSMTSAMMELPSGGSQFALDVLIRLDEYDESVHECRWGVFEGNAGAARLRGQTPDGQSMIVATQGISFLASQQSSGNPYSSAQYPTYYAVELNGVVNSNNFIPNAGFVLDIIENGNGEVPTPSDNINIPVDINFY